MQETKDSKHIFRCLLGMDTSLSTDVLKNALTTLISRQLNYETHEIFVLNLNHNLPY